MDIFVWTLLLAVAVVIAKVAVKIVLVFYERERNRKIQSGLADYLKKNRVMFNGQNEKVDDELPKRE